MQEVAWDQAHVLLRELLHFLSLVLSRDAKRSTRLTWYHVLGQDSWAEFRQPERDQPADNNDRGNSPAAEGHLELMVILIINKTARQHCEEQREPANPAGKQTQPVSNKWAGLHNHQHICSLIDVKSPWQNEFKIYKKTCGQYSARQSLIREQCDGHLAKQASFLYRNNATEVELTLQGEA